MKLQKISLPILLLVFCISGMAQVEQEKEAGDEAAALQEKAVEFLKDTASEISTLRTNENRISFSSELANLMWFRDEKEARKMFSAVADSFVRLVAEYNARVEALGGMRDETDIYGGFDMSTNERRGAIRKLYKARDVRGQIALAIAEHDAQLAYDFVIRTSTIVTDKELAAAFLNQNESLEREILEQISVTDAGNALAFGRQSLKRGLSPQLVTLAVKVYAKDPEAAIKFGKELVGKVRAEAGSEVEKIETIGSILRAGGSVLDNADSGKEPLFDRATLRGLADLLARNLIESEEFPGYLLEQYVSEIEKYSPAQARRVKTKFAEKDGIASMPPPPPPVIEGEGDAPALTREQAAEQRSQEERAQLMNELKEFGNNELSAEEKSMFVDKARRITADMSDPMMKVAALSTLAATIKRIGDNKLASDMMREATTLLKPEPRNFMDYLLVWSVVSGFAEVAPDQAFPQLEEAIYRINDTIGAFVKVAEFMDVQGEIIIDGELQLGAFGGPTSRSAVSMMRNSGNVLKSLSVADFDRTKSLADKFEKPEVRILARFLILRSVLETGEAKEIGLIK